MRKEDSVQRHNDHAFFYLDCPFFCRVIQLQYLVGWCILTFQSIPPGGWVFVVGLELWGMLGGGWGWGWCRVGIVGWGLCVCGCESVRV